MRNRLCLYLIHVVLTHTSGAISYVQGTWGTAGTVFHTSADIAGTAGVLTIDTSRDTGVVADIPANRGGEGYLPPSAHAESPYTTQLREIAAAFAGGPIPRVTAEDGIRAVALAEAAAESIRTGRAIDVDLARVVAAEPESANV